MHNQTIDSNNTIRKASVGMVVVLHPSPLVQQPRRSTLWRPTP
jgi:hypothetical protein